MTQLSHKKKTRQMKHHDVLKCAEQVFCKKGYVATTTEEIAEESGHSVGTIYNLFKSKELLFSEVILEISQDLIREVEKDLDRAGRDPESVLERQLMIRLEQQERYRLFMQLFYFQGPQTGSEFQQLPAGVFESCTRYFHVMEDLFCRIFSGMGVPSTFATHQILCFEGYINMYIGYQRYEPKNFSRARMGKFVRQFFIDSMRRMEHQNKSTVADRTEDKQIYITRFDLVRLIDLITVSRSLKQHQLENHLISLEQELNRAKIVRPNEVPSDVVTMNSRVRVQNVNDRDLTIYTLVFPTDADRRERISILDPLGTAMLGHRVGDVFCVILPSDQEIHYQVEDVLYQPEAAGDFHL